jgi:hypothetical protein
LTTLGYITATASADEISTRSQIKLQKPSQYPDSVDFHSGCPHPQAHTILAAAVAKSDATTAAIGIMVPTIAMLVNVANNPPAGVKPPYIHDWKAAANVPEDVPNDV